MGLSWIDRHYLARAYELARRGIGNVSPNPPVGAVLVGEGNQTLSEGFHHRRGDPHAEVETFRSAASRGVPKARYANATLYVSLEPCNHHGRTPPCSEAVIGSGVKRVVIGTTDPNPRTALGGVRRLKEAGVEVVIADDPQARELIEPFALMIRLQRPFVTLKMASSLDGRIAPHPGQHWLTGEAARRYVRHLRSIHDIVLVGDGTARIDDPDLTPRPPRTRYRRTMRGVICSAKPPPRGLKIFAQSEAETILLIPAHAAIAYEPYGDWARVIAIETGKDGRISPVAALTALARLDIGSVLCEGGPTIASAFLAANVVDRLEWLIAPQFLASPTAVPVLPSVLDHRRFRWDCVEQMGEDLHLSVPLYQHRMEQAAPARKNETHV